MYVLIAVIIGLVLAWLFFNRKENLTHNVPPFPYPTDIQQPLGPQGWGYRDPLATYKTLLWEQYPCGIVMPKPELYKPTICCADMSVPSAPVAKKCSIGLRPPVTKAVQRPVAQSPYANWASTLQP